MLTADEKMCLRNMVKKEIENIKQKEKLIAMPLNFIKAEHEYKHFLEKLMKKLE